MSDSSKSIKEKIEASSILSGDIGQHMRDFLTHYELYVKLPQVCKSINTSYKKEDQHALLLRGRNYLPKRESSFSSYIDQQQNNPYKALPTEISCGLDQLLRSTRIKNLLDGGISAGELIKSIKKTFDDLALYNPPLLNFYSAPFGELMSVGFLPNELLEFKSVFTSKQLLNAYRRIEDVDEVLRISREEPNSIHEDLGNYIEPTPTPTSTQSSHTL